MGLGHLDPESLRIHRPHVRTTARVRIFSPTPRLNSLNDGEQTVSMVTCSGRRPSDAGDENKMELDCRSVHGVRRPDHGTPALTGSFPSLEPRVRVLPRSSVSSTHPPRQRVAVSSRSPGSICLHNIYQLLASNRRAQTPVYSRHRFNVCDSAHQLRL